MMWRKSEQTNSAAGFSLIELLLALTLTLIILGTAVVSFSGALSSRTRESSKTDAITSTQAALNIMSREIGNAGFGLTYNGLGWFDSSGVFQTDSTNKRLHFRANTDNSNSTTNDIGEDVTFYWTDNSIVRYDASVGTPEPSGIINRISDVEFTYINYTYNAVTDVVSTSETSSPTANTAKVRILLTVTLPNVNGQPSGQSVKVQSEVTLRNSPYMLGQY